MKVVQGHYKAVVEIRKLQPGLATTQMPLCNYVKYLPVLLVPQGRRLVIYFQIAKQQALGREVGPTNRVMPD
jgi:hypothetical protein